MRSQFLVIVTTSTLSLLAGQAYGQTTPFNSAIAGTGTVQAAGAAASAIASLVLPPAPVSVSVSAISQIPGAAGLASAVSSLEPGGSVTVEAPGGGKATITKDKSGKVSISKS